MEVCRAADLTPPRELLGWTPTTHLHGGLKRTVEWFRDHPHYKGRRLTIVVVLRVCQPVHDERLDGICGPDNVNR
jgi:hypothetical protein